MITVNEKREQTGRIRMLPEQAYPDRSDNTREHCLADLNPKQRQDHNDDRREDQICKELEPDAQKFAIDMENSVIVVAPLVPWSIAGAVPLASVSAPLTSIVAAVFLYLLPLWYFGVRLRKK